jgi:hypothetical protein
MIPMMQTEYDGIKKKTKENEVHKARPFTSG